MVQTAQAGETGGGGSEASQHKISIVDIATEVEKNRQETVRKHVQVHGLSVKMVHATLHNDLKLCKKLARWLSKLMDKEMKN